MIYLVKRTGKDSDDVIAFILGSAIDVAIQSGLLIMAIFFLLTVGAKWLIIFLATAAFHAAVYFTLKGKLFELSTALRDMIHARRHLIAALEQKEFIKNDTASGGERRRASIDTALKKSADVLILDEPDNNLDAAAVDMLTKKIVACKAQRITLIISHDKRLIALADEVLTLPSNFFVDKRGDL